MTIKQKVAKLKMSLMDGRMVLFLRASINRIEEKEKGFLFCLDRAVPCVLHFENRVNEKLVIMTLLEGLKHRTNGAMSLAYFQEIADALLMVCFQNRMVTGRFLRRVTS